MPTREFISTKLPRLTGVLVDYCQRLSCQRDKSNLCRDSVFNHDSDSHSGANALVLVVFTIKDTVTTQAKDLSRWHSSSYNNSLVPAVIRGDFLQKTHKFGRPGNALAQWCTFWPNQPRVCVRSPGINPGGIMCILGGVVLGVQAPR